MHANLKKKCLTTNVTNYNSTSVGTLEFRCITEPVRNDSSNHSYYQAQCNDIGKFYML